MIIFKSQMTSVSVLFARLRKKTENNPAISCEIAKEVKTMRELISVVNRIDGIAWCHVVASSLSYVVK